MFGYFFKTHRAPPCSLTLVVGLFLAISPPLLTLVGAPNASRGPNVRRGAGEGDDGNTQARRRHIVSNPTTRVKVGGAPYVTIGKKPQITILVHKCAGWPEARRARGGAASHGI